MALTLPAKDPDEVLDYLVDWSARLVEGDAIVTSTWVMQDGITKDSDEHTDETTTIWLSGGTLGTTYSLVNRAISCASRASPDEALFNTPEEGATMNRAYSLITITKAVDDVDAKRRTFSGWATTPELDRVNDTIDPMGTKFSNPLTLLRNHDSDCPIGKVVFKKPTKKGIEFDAEIPMIDEPGLLKDRLDMAWGEIKSKIISAVSIGFRPLKYAFKDDGGIEFQEIEIFELSAVSIPANAGALITSVKSIDKKLRQVAGVPEPDPIKNPNTPPPAASGQKAMAVVRLTPPASGKSKTLTTPQEGSTVKISEKIARFEEKRAANTARRD